MKMNDFEAEKKVIDKVIGAAIVAARRMEGMTQEQLAEKLSMSRTSLSLYESGERSLHAWQLAQIMQHLPSVFIFLK